jgi:hypothetical protein
MAKGTGPMRRRKRIPVVYLYPEPDSEPSKHAKALIELVQQQCPELIGKFVPQSHLARMYVELCRQEQWQPFGWMTIGRQLRPLVGGRKHCAKRNGKRFRVYPIPKRCRDEISSRL